MASYYGKFEMVELLKDKAQELKRVPTAADFDEKIARIITGYFKKWDKALKAAQISENTFATAKKANTVKKAETSCAAKPKEEKKGETEKPAETASACKKVYSKEMIAEMLLAEFNRLGKRPTKKDIDANKDLPSASTCLKYFNTTRLGDMWDEILK